MEIEKILEERGKTHGDFTENAEISQRLKDLVRPTASRRTDVQNEALDMILHKISRICVGDPNHQDNYDDIAGYAKLVSDRLEK